MLTKSCLCSRPSRRAADHRFESAAAGEKRIRATPGAGLRVHPGAGRGNRRAGSQVVLQLAASSGLPMDSRQETSGKEMCAAGTGLRLSLNIIKLKRRAREREAGICYVYVFRSLSRG